MIMKNIDKLAVIRYMIEKTLCFVMVFCLTPGYYIFQLTIIRPHIVRMYQMGTLTHLFYVGLSFFIFVNVCGNMFMFLFTDTRVPRKSVGIQGTCERYCEHCKVLQPQKSFHCKTCNVCILRRDHHCFFFSRCVGLYNQRYYMCYTLHSAIGLIYGTYFDYFYISSMFETYEFMFAVLRIFNPMLTLLVSEPVGMRDFYVLFFDFNGIFICWAFCVLYFHMKNILKGITAYEYKAKVKTDSPKWKENIIKVFGTRWYLAVIWPFAESPLPRNNCELLEKTMGNKDV